MKTTHRRTPARGVAGSVLRRRAVCAAAAAACLFAAAFTGGCTRDLTDSGDFGPNPSPSDDYATLRLVVPGVSTAGTYAADVAQETLLEAGKLHVLLYAKNDEDNWQFVSVTTPEAEDIGEAEVAENGNGSATYDIRIPFPAGNTDRTFRAGLVSGLTLDELKAQGGYTDTEDGPWWTVFASCTVDEEGTRVENPLSEARLRLTFDTEGKWPVPPAEDFRSFPMWGESGTFALRPGATLAGTIRMTRAVARVDVGVNFQKDEEGRFPLDDMQAQGLYNGGKGTYFELESVSVYRTATGGVCGAREGNIDTGTGQVTDITLSDLYATYDDTAPLRYTFDAGELTTPAGAVDADAANRRSLTRQCYVPETGNHGLEFDDAACIVVGGKYGSATAKTTYYRIDFAEVQKDEAGGDLKPTPESRIDLRRNHAYVVNITSVSGHGEDTEDDALRNENTKLTAEVVDWDQSQQVGDIVTDGVYSLSLSKREQKFYCDGTPEALTVTTDYDGELGKGWKLTIEGDDDFKKNIRYYDAEGTAYAPGSPGWPSQGPKGTTELRFGMEELANDIDGRERTLSGRLVFEAGRMKSQVSVSQTSRDLLRILFDPEELYFGPEGPEKSVGISVTTKKEYTLTLSGTDGSGTKYSYTIYPETGGTIPDDRFKTFFARVRDAKDEYLVEPAKLPEGQDSRVFTFEVTAELKNNNAVNPVTERFTVYQLKEPVEWKVVANTVHPYELRQNGGYEVVVAHDATDVWPKIETTPSSLIWWFSRGEAGVEDTWLTNLATWYGKKIENVAETYRDGLEFTLEPNTGLGRRSVTVQVESNTPGLSPRESNLRITQKGKPLTLEPSIQAGPEGKTIVKESDPAGGNPGVYVLDHGYGATGGAYTLAMKSNTNWYWYWNTDDGQQVHEANKGLVAPDWKLGTGFEDGVPTTDHPDDGKSEHTWETVATFTVPDFDQGDTKFDETQKDQAQLDVPLGGERTVVRELRNVHPELTADDMEENARQLHIRRELPAHTHIIEWPWADMTSLNWAMENGQYDDKLFRFGTNATGKLTLTTGFDLAEQEQPNSEKTYTSTQGYQLFEEKFADLTRVAVTPESENDDPVFYKLHFTGRTANEDETANEAVDEKRIYYTGTQMNVPWRNMETGQYYLSSGAHTLRLDFSNSYFNKVKVRVKAVLVNTDETEDGVDAYWTALQTSEPDVAADPTQAKERYLYPTTNWAEGVIFTSDGGSKEIQMDLPENKHKNMMYKVVVEYARHKGGGNFADGPDDWLEIAGLEIYQDGNPIDGAGIIWKYMPLEWPGELWSGFTTDKKPSLTGPVFGGPEDDGTWSCAAPLDITTGTWNSWKSSFEAAKARNTVYSDVVGPGGVTGVVHSVSSNKQLYVAGGISGSFGSTVGLPNGPFYIKNLKVTSNDPTATFNPTQKLMSFRLKSDHWAGLKLFSSGVEPSKGAGKSSRIGPVKVYLENTLVADLPGVFTNTQHNYAPEQCLVNITFGIAGATDLGWSTSRWDYRNTRQVTYFTFYQPWKLGDDKFNGGIYKDKGICDGKWGNGDDITLKLTKAGQEALGLTVESINFRTEANAVPTSWFRTAVNKTVILDVKPQDKEQE